MNNENKYEQAYNKARKEIRRLHNVIKEQKEELEYLRYEWETIQKSDPYREEQQPKESVNLFEQDFKDCGDTGHWEYVEFDDIDGGNGTETWHNKQTGKYYAIEVERVRRAECAEDISDEWYANKESEV